MSSRPCAPTLTSLSPLLSATDTIKQCTKPSVAITALANTTTEVTMSLCLTLRRVRKQMFFLPLSVFLTCVTSTPLYVAVSYVCCIFDKHFLAANLYPSFSIRLFTFLSSPASRNSSPLRFAVFTHFLQVLSKLHNKSKFTKYFPLCKTRFAWAIVSLLSYFVPRWTPGPIEFFVQPLHKSFNLNCSGKPTSESCLP